MALPLFWVAAAAAAAGAGLATFFKNNDTKSSKSNEATRTQSQVTTTNQDFLDDIYDTEDDYIDYVPTNITQTEENRAALERIENAHREIYKACDAEKMRQIKEDAQKRKKDNVQSEISPGVEADRFKAVELKKILKPLREAAGFTAEEFGERLDLSRQAIANLENSSTKLSVSQFWAIIAFLMFQEGPHCLVNKSTFVIILDCLVENQNKYTKEARKEVENNLRLLAIATKTAIKQADKSGMKKMADQFAEEIARISNEGHIRN